MTTLNPWIERWAAPLALLALLVPVLAPALDHHSAERMPFHGHLVAVPPGHPHGGESRHYHESSVAADRSTSVVVVPDRDAYPAHVGQAGPGPWMDTALIQRPRRAADHAGPALPKDGARPPERYLEPPKHPPRA